MEWCNVMTPCCLLTVYESRVCVSLMMPWPWAIKGRAEVIFESGHWVLSTTWLHVCEMLVLRRLSFSVKCMLADVSHSSLMRVLVIAIVSWISVDMCCELWSPCQVWQVELNAVYVVWMDMFKRNYKNNLKNAHKEEDTQDKWGLGQSTLQFQQKQCKWERQPVWIYWPTWRI